LRFLLYRAALALITALPLRLVFSLERLGLVAWLLLRLIGNSPAGIWILRFVQRSPAGKKKNRAPSFSAARRKLLSGMKLNSTALEKVRRSSADLRAADEATREPACWD